VCRSRCFETMPLRPMGQATLVRADLAGFEWRHENPFRPGPLEQLALSGDPSNSGYDLEAGGIVEVPVVQGHAASANDQASCGAGDHARQAGASGAVVSNRGEAENFRPGSNRSHEELSIP
jgi:hypothetical protein